MKTNVITVVCSCLVPFLRPAGDWAASASALGYLCVQCCQGPRWTGRDHFCVEELGFIRGGRLPGDPHGWGREERGGGAEGRSPASGGEHGLHETEANGENGGRCSYCVYKPTQQLRGCELLFLCVYHFHFMELSWGMRTGFLFCFVFFYPLIGVFRLFTFIIAIDMVRFKPIIFLFICLIWVLFKKTFSFVQLPLWIRE